MSTTQQAAISVEDAIEGFRTRFDESLQLHMRSDVEVGACLSGGLDSSSIVSRLSRLNPGQRMKAFTIYYEGHGGVDERPWVNEVLSAYPNIEGFTHTPTDDEVADVFADALWHADVPLSGSSPLSQYFVMQLAAKQGVKVLLDGQGADEMLGGYMHSFYRLIGGLFAQGRIPSAIREWDAHSRMQGFSLAKRTDSWLKSVLAGLRSEQQLYAFEYLNYLPFVGLEKSVPFAIRDQQGSRLNRFLHTLTTVSSLPTLLQFEDRNSMAFSIESRVPFLDHRLVEFVFSLKDSCKINRGVTKHVLRQAMKGTLPEPIANRKDKKGFVTPGEVRWLRGPLRFLLDQEFDSIDWLNR
ncbi:MAG: asparagine synthetase B family protein, partial [Bacteroidota bacterium]